MNPTTTAAPRRPNCTPAGGHLLERARGLSGLIEREAVATEQGGTLSPATIAAFRDTELFWMLVPQELGGNGTDILSAMEVIVELSRADGSTGWSLMVNAVATALAGAYCGPQAVEVMFGGAERPIVAGMLGPGGQSKRVPGGYEGGGRYSFGSACAHANWLTAGMFVSDASGQRLLASGQPEVRVCFIPAARLRLNGNWNVMGLQGTGSYDYEVSSQFVADDFTMERTQTQPRRGLSHFQFGVAGMGCAGHTATVLGIMKRALQEIARIASEKRRPGYDSVVAAHPLFREQFARHEAQYQAAHAWAFRVFGEAQAVAAVGSSLDAHRSRFRQVITWTHQLTTQIVHFAYSWAGQQAFRNPSALGRCMRDALVAQQHVYVDPITLVDAGTELIKQWSAQATAGASDYAG